MLSVSNDFLILQEVKPGVCECICKQTGLTRRIAKAEIGPHSPVDFPIADGYDYTSARPIESLEKLRELRTQVVLDYRKAKAKARAASKTPREKKPRAMRTSVKLKAKLASLPPEMQALLKASLEAPK